MADRTWIARADETHVPQEQAAEGSAPGHSRQASGDDDSSFRLALMKALQAAHDSATIEQLAAQALVEHLSVSSACFGEADATGSLTVRGAHARAASSSTSGPGSRCEAALPPLDPAARTVCVSDVDREAALDPQQRSELKARGVRAYITVPLLQEKRVVAALWLHQDRPRNWSPAERSLAQEAAELTWAAVQRGRAEAALSASEERLRSTARRRDEFLALLGHELRNPMASLITSLHLIRKRSGSQLDHPLDIAERQAGNLARMVDDLLEASRVTEGKLQLRREAIDLRHVVQRAIEGTRELSEQRNQTLSVDLPASAVIAWADPLRVEQILTNLLTNACKYTAEYGHVWVSLSATDNMGELSVRDDGVGISADLLPHLFDLFQQGGRDLSRALGGLGIGLTIVRKLVELHGGRVEAHSEGPGKGSEFVVRLPLAAEQTRAVPEPSADPRSPPGQPAQRRVLVIDDNADAGEALAELIDDLGHESRRATDGPSGLALCKEWQPELVFLDIGMPGMDGYEVARELRRLNFTNTKLVALTGYGQASDRQKAREAGFDQHLVKPPQIETIENILQELD